MRLLITGGGTGGHIYPALEVGRHAVEQGAELVYYGSLRGQEGRICQARGIRFKGFPSEPLYSIRTLRGIKAALKILQATQMAKSALRKERPDVIFSTGGYSAAPVMKAAASLGIPYVIHEANSVPGRSNVMFARQAAFVSTAYHQSEKHFPGAKVVRTGMPIRKQLREKAAEPRPDAPPLVLVVGGSQGSKFLNESVPLAARHVESVDWIHVTGPSHIDAVRAFAQEQSLPDRYQLKPFLEAEEMADAYRRATVAVARSGGTMAEFAMFGLPSVVVPLPSAAGNHQFHNASEFAEMGATTVVLESNFTPESMGRAIQGWLDSPERREAAKQAMASWDAPDATERIFDLIREAAK